MRVIEIAPDRSLVPVDRPAPRLAPGEVRIEVAYCGICGSDLHMRTDPGIPAGTVLGHEFAGRISEIGDGVQGWSVGDRVAVLPHVSCGECRYCRAGQENFCVSGGHLGWVIGVQGQGGLAESVVAPASCLFAVPEGVTDAQAALAEPVAVAARAAGQVTCAPDEPVTVVGAGPIGLLISLILRHKGFADVTIMERSSGRRAIAESLGLRATAPADDAASPAGERPAVVVDASGSPAAIAMGVRLLRNRGKIVLVGLPGDEVPMDVAYLVLHEITVAGAAGYNRADFAHALELLAKGAIPTDRIITEIADLSAAGVKFQELADPGTRQIKVLLHP